MSILSQINQILATHNKNNPNLRLAVDTIRADFNRTTPIKSDTKINVFLNLPVTFNLKWYKLKKSNYDYVKLKKYLHKDELKTVYQLGNGHAFERIYYYYKKPLDKSKTKATLVIYGLKQYHHCAPNVKLIDSLLDLVNNVSSVDLCFDRQEPFNVAALKSIFTLETYQETTHYINDTGIYSIPHICIYDKALKNGLREPLHRIEAKAIIRNYSVRNRVIDPKNPKERLAEQLQQATQDFDDIIKLATNRPLIRLSRPYK
ncbi:hypothetical protein ACLH6Q_000500 [Campylobacter fetus]|uniref:hypothetical protein n=1 Tax=Campylobacter fetus TaxID=196 RepID=UPI00081899E4|nr:hypothetical protein [Campylobacter fetus]EAH8299927.1 hypothetical protein [Campylobacter fetus]EAI7232641.1 hypothetical protein [Campylobacter fetus]EAJ5689501.1 hypothetical protein [Campylobacter fetus]EAK0427778.1 hypothetical protein [Campylobacter fetus]EAK5305169.1 hypothetical protein [Campylobacter fetus]